MEISIIDTLKQLQQQFDLEQAKAVMQTMKNGDEFFTQIFNEDGFEELINVQSDEFYQVLAKTITVNNCFKVFEYIYVWDYIFAALNEDVKQKLITNIEDRNDNEDVIYTLKALLVLEQDPKLAIENLEFTNTHITAYLKGLAYFDLGNYNQAIVNLEEFLDLVIEFNKDTIAQGGESILEYDEFKIFIWNVHNLLLQSYDNTKEYHKAIKHLKAALGLFELEEAEELFGNEEDPENDDFKIFITYAQKIAQSLDNQEILETITPYL